MNISRVIALCFAFFVSGYCVGEFTSKRFYTKMLKEQAEEYNEFIRWLSAHFKLHTKKDTEGKE